MDKSDYNKKIIIDQQSPKKLNRGLSSKNDSVNVVSNIELEKSNKPEMFGCMGKNIIFNEPNWRVIGGMVEGCFEEVRYVRERRRIFQHASMISFQKIVDFWYFWTC